MNPEPSADVEPVALSDVGSDGGAAFSELRTHEGGFEGDATVAESDWTTSNKGAASSEEARDDLKSDPDSAGEVSWDAEAAAEPLWNTPTPELVEISPEMEEFRQRLSEAGVAFAETFLQVSFLEFLSRMEIDHSTELSEAGFEGGEDRPGLLVSKDYLADWSPEHVHEALGAGAALLVAFHLFSEDEAPVESESASGDPAEEREERAGLLSFEGVTLTANGDVLLHVRDPRSEGGEIQIRSAEEVLALIGRPRGAMMVPSTS